MNDLYLKFTEMHRVCLQYTVVYKQRTWEPGRRMAEQQSNSSPSTMTRCGLFEEDAVSVTKDGQFRCGVVVESCEYVSSDEDDGDDDDSDTADDKLRRGTVRVAWHPEGTEEVVNENTVLKRCKLIYATCL